MATFEYTARVDPSRMQAGTIEAESAMSAARRLKTQGLYPIRVETCSRGVRRFGWLVGRWRLGHTYALAGQ